MLKRFALPLLLCLVCTTPALAQKAPTLPRLQSFTEAAAGPPSYNYVSVRGLVTTVYLGSADFGAFELRLQDGSGVLLRFECRNNATRLGCAALHDGDLVQIYASLRGIIAPICSPPLWDGVLDVADISLLYRNEGGFWRLLTSV